MFMKIIKNKKEKKNWLKTKIEILNDLLLDNNKNKLAKNILLIIKLFKEFKKIKLD